MAPRKRKAGGGEDGRASKLAKPSTDRRITRNMTIDGPRQAVFKTTELLEQILLYLPPKNIFGVQRVSRQFRDAVATSPAIGKKLFVRSSDEERQTWTVQSNKSANPAHKRLPPTDVQLVVCPSTKHNNDYDGKWTPARLNPLLHVSGLNNYRSTTRRIWRSDGDTVRPSSQFKLRPRASASWRNMLLTDPPTFVADVSLDIFADKYKNWWGEKKTTIGDKSSSAQALTLGMVVDAAMSDEGDVVVLKDSGEVRLHKFSLNDLTKELGETDRQQARFRWQDTWILLEGVVIPSEEEWETVK